MECFLAEISSLKLSIHYVTDYQIMILRTEKTWPNEGTFFD